MSRTLTSLALVLTLALAGCGDGDDASGSGEDAGGSGDAVAVVADDFEFRPSEVTAQPGATLTLELSNEGEAPHTFTAEDLGVDEELQPGQSRQVEVDVPGDLSGATFFCRFHNQMKGTISSA